MGGIPKWSSKFYRRCKGSSKGKVNARIVPWTGTFIAPGHRARLYLKILNGNLIIIDFQAPETHLRAKASAKGVNHGQAN
jgi:hypothetical protein